MNLDLKPCLSDYTNDAEFGVAVKQWKKNRNSNRIPPPVLEDFGSHKDYVIAAAEYRERHAVDTETRREIEFPD